jgi:hypothetical protein
MTADRSKAYGKVLQILADKGPGGLNEHEAQALRDAADALLFGRAGEEAVGDARFAAEAIVARLTGSGRWVHAEGDRLLEALTACGPHAPIPA